MYMYMYVHELCTSKIDHYITAVHVSLYHHTGSLCYGLCDSFSVSCAKNMFAFSISQSYNYHTYMI
jgi:hypothetical protein